MSRQRARIDEFVAANPGVHFNQIVRDLDLAPGQVQYHVRRLVGDRSVRREEFYGRTHYYPPTCDAWERGALSLARRETARDVLYYLLENGGAAPEAVASAIGVARSTLEWHVDHLVEQALVKKARDDQNRVTLVLLEPERTLEVLSTVEPSLPERLVDRFDRLLDVLLEP